MSLQKSSRNIETRVILRAHPILKAASIDFDLYLGDDKLAELSKLKSKNELIGEVIGLLQSPSNNVVSGSTKWKELHLQDL